MEILVLKSGIIMVNILEDVKSAIISSYIWLIEYSSGEFEF